jgi:L-asparaginase/Glu-tRNA(Gln) amidotransferase subunit D
MFEAVKYALSKNVPVVVLTRVHNGRVLQNGVTSQADLQAAFTR